MSRGRMGGPLVLARDIVRLFGKGHESDTPPNQILEKEMDLHNNEEGIMFCIPCYPNTHANNTISNGIVQLLNQGNLLYLFPIDYSDYQNPVFWNNPNTNTQGDGHHGILPNTQLIPTNQ